MFPHSAACLVHPIKRTWRLACAAAGHAQGLSSSSTEFVNRMATDGVRAAESVHPVAGDMARVAADLISQAVRDLAERQARAREGAAPTAEQVHESHPLAGHESLGPCLVPCVCVFFNAK
jgi:hypothetical protein